jgi:hypothetical protein
MIILESPHMGLNDQRAPAAVQMWNTWGCRARRRASTSFHGLPASPEVLREVS